MEKCYNTNNGGAKACWKERYTENQMSGSGHQIKKQCALLEPD